jgi:predicted dithiol-disulfide oxidoreductase (DUF899 family)
MTREVASFNALRRDFPMVKVDKEYTFEGVDGKATLSDLFQGRKQLIIYHFMLGPDDEAGCTGCSFLADNLPSSLTHLNYRDTTLVRIFSGALLMPRIPQSSNSRREWAGTFHGSPPLVPTSIMISRRV